MYFGFMGTAQTWFIQEIVTTPNTMKNKFIMLALLLCAASCKKQTAIPAGENGKPEPKVYTYRIDVNNYAKPDYGAKVTGDTLIVKINGVTVVNAVGPNVPAYVPELSAKTGDRLYVYYNPGTYIYGQQKVVEYNYLEIMFTGGYKNPSISWGCRCVGVYDDLIHE